MARVAVALLLGLLAALASAAAPEGFQSVVTKILEPIGTLWVNAIRMTVLPLIVSLLVVGVASGADTARIGRLGVRALATFYSILIVVAAGVAIVTPALFAGLRLDPARVAALRASVAGGAAAAQVPSFRDWLVSLVPVNPIGAAADGSILPLLVFTIAFSFALTRVDAREPVLGFFRTVRDAMIVLAGWIFLLAPAGVFALAYALGGRLGAGAAGALGLYVAVQVGLHVAVLLALYALVAIRGEVGVRTFAAAAAPAQLVGLSTRSSFAALPAMIEGATRRLRLPPDATAFVLPLALSTFKLTSSINCTVGAVFIAKLYGVEMGAQQVATVAVVSVLLNPTSPGIPSGGLLVQAPLFAALGLPAEGIGILIAVDLIPDVFKTLVNVTGDMAAATLVARPEPSPLGEPG